MAEKKEEKKEEPTLEMRIAALENRVGGGAQQQMEFTEQEAAAYNKIADALGIGVEMAGGCRWQPPPGGCRWQPPPGGCRWQPPNACRVQACRIQTCRIQPCRIQPCRIQTCRIQTCISQCIGQCVNECFACYASDDEVDLSGGFGTLGYYY
jgi:hypothetical protein